MNKEQVFIIDILRDHIHNRKSLIPEQLDWPMIQMYAKQQQIEGIVYQQTKSPLFQKASVASVYFSANRKAILKNLLKDMSVPFFLVKGAEVAELYPTPAFRSMGDTDLVIRRQDRNAVHEIMMAHGFQNESQYEDREWVYYKNGMEFELHDHLVYEEDINEDKQTEFLNGFWDYVTENKLDWNFHFIFLIFHLKKHFMNTGVGFRQFLDLAVVMDKIQLDWKWIEARLDEIELLSFAKVALSFCDRWFGVKAPIELTEIDDAFYEEATEKIFKDGIFGFDNEENEHNYAVNLQRKQGKSGAVLKALRAVFPSYDTLVGSSRYSFMKGKRYLLPAAWVYRIVSGVKRGHLSSGIEQTTKNFVSDEYKKKREEWYRRWGI